MSRDIQSLPRESSKSPPPRPGRKVHFRVCEFSYFEPGLEQEIALDRKKDLYYTETDYDRIEAESHTTVRRMLRSKSSPTQLEKNLIFKRNLSSRGLEERIPFRAREQMRTQMKAVRLVLTVQRFQKENDECTDLQDEEVIAMRYRRLALPATRAAHARGLQDKIFAEWIAEGCPEDKPATSNNNGNSNIFADSKVLDMQEPVKRHRNQHHRNESPHFSFFCGRGLSHFFQQPRRFEAVNAS